ncbi:hypothetical protein ONE63_002658 [Megalurothrips usitatus]|uniref:Chloride channel CLIC-like protein 1 n=1 Tax=Megalurothrips usitatus TaxID=439358 RepID=A0AAV7XD43_9NEOP|nr:hypothetical protein ONE63_002658 [Megalurothrips usitatus]
MSGGDMSFFGVGWILPRSAFDAKGVTFKFGMSSCTVYHCLVLVGFILASASSQDISMSPPDTEGWLSPDPDFFPPGQAPQSDILGVNKLEVECQENLKVCATRYADCERSLQNTILDKNKLTDVPLNEVSTSSTVAPKVCGAEVYLQRFIRRLLEISDLNTGDMQVQNTAEIKIYISDEQLLIFRQFAKEGKIPLRKLDAIFDAVFVKPYFDLPKVEKLLEKLPSIEVGSFFLSILLPAVWFMSVLLVTRNIRKSFIWFVPITFVTSFITTAYRMFEEGQLQQYEQMKKFPDIPTDCQKNGKSLLSILGFSWGKSDCAKYLMAHNIDPNLHITPVRVIAKMFGETLSDTMENIGIGTVGFFQRFAELGLFTQTLVLPLGCALLCVIGLLIFLVTAGGSIKLPWFLASVNFNGITSETVSSHDGGPDTTRSFKRLEATPINQQHNF